MISILLTSFNGEKFIEMQIDSLFKQSVQDFKLFINDDNSTDSTFSIIQGYALKFPDRVFISQNEANSGSAKANFISMMSIHKNDYVMLCDQDDIWLPDKIEKCLGKIRELELRHGRSTPLLVHSDLTVVGEGLEVISPSHMKRSKARFDRNKFNNLVIQNIVTGCTVMYNRALADLILDNKPEYMIMHDWWLALVASAFGKIGAVSEPTMLYRQHENNEFGANERSSGSHLFHKLFNFNEVTETLDSTYRQTGSFLSLYGEHLPMECAELAEEYSSIPDKKKLDRMRTFSKYRIWKNGFIRKVAQILAVV